MTSSAARQQGAIKVISQDRPDLAAVAPSFMSLLCWLHFCIVDEVIDG